MFGYMTTGMIGLTTSFYHTAKCISRKLALEATHGNRNGLLFSNLQHKEPLQTAEIACLCRSFFPFWTLQ